MSFAAEMRDFYSAFNTMSNAAGNIRDKIDARKNTFDANSIWKDAPGGVTGPGFEKTSKSKVPTGEVKKIIDANTPPELRDYAYRMASKESSFDPSAKSSTGASGLFQFTEGTGAQYGLLGQNGDMRSDPALNTQAFVKFTEDNRNYLRKALGREPNEAELAIAHQQGAAGAEYLITGRVPKGLDLAKLQKSLRLNNARNAADIAAYYGFDMKAGPATEVASAIPSNYTQWGGDAAETRAPAKTPAYEVPSEAYASEDQPYDLVDHNAGIDVAGIEVPEGSDPYQPFDMSEEPTVALAEGGSVPWSGATSRVANRYPSAATYRPPQYSPSNSSASAIPSSNSGSGSSSGSMWGPGYDILKMQQKYGPNYMAWADKLNNATGGNLADFLRSPGGTMLYAMSNRPKSGDPRSTYSNFAEGGPVGYGGTHTSDPPMPTSALPDGHAEPAEEATPQSNPAPKVTLGQALDLGFKHLTRSLGLDKRGAAVGPDSQLQDGQRKLVNGAISPTEGPPSNEEVQQAYQLVDPDNQLRNGLKTVYTMQKGVEFYLQRGEIEKAGKWAAGLIQYSNLMSRRYGYEAVQAGQNGDMDGMVKYAIKAYENIPDALDVSAQRKGNGVEVTRTDEDGNVVDQHMLSPQQIFQMATGISKGSGYFEALLPLADPSGENRRAKAAQQTAGWGSKAAAYEADLERVRDKLSPAEANAVQSAIDAGRETGDFGHASQLISNLAATAASAGKVAASDKDKTDYYTSRIEGMGMSDSDKAIAMNAIKHKQWNDLDNIIKTSSADSGNTGTLKPPKMNKDYQELVASADDAAANILGIGEQDPAEFRKAQGRTFTSMRDLIANVSNYNGIPVDTAAQVVDQISMGGQSSNQTTDKYGNLIVTLDDGTSVKLPAAAKAQIEFVRNARASAIPAEQPPAEQPPAEQPPAEQSWRNWFFGGNEQPEQPAQGEQAVPTGPQQPVQGKTLSGEELVRMKSAIERGAPPDKIKAYLRQQGYSTEGL